MAELKGSGEGLFIGSVIVASVIGDISVLLRDKFDNVDALSVDILNSYVLPLTNDIIGIVPFNDMNDFSGWSLLIIILSITYDAEDILLIILNDLFVIKIYKNNVSSEDVENLLTKIVLLFSSVKLPTTLLYNID